MIVRPYGPAAWLVDEVDDPVAWTAGLHAEHLDGVREVVPAERTVVVTCDREHHEAIGAVLPSIGLASTTGVTARHQVVEVIYDGEDLAATAAAVGISVAEVIQRHTAPTYTVAFCGFSPGFAYLRGLDPALAIARRPTPRTNVPAGAVAIAAGYSCIYPSASPGGWQLLGRTDLVVFDVEQAQPALLTPGTTVTFEAIGP